jgi:hypothetical protein
MALSIRQESISCVCKRCEILGARRCAATRYQARRTSSQDRIRLARHIGSGFQVMPVAHHAGATRELYWPRRTEQHHRGSTSLPPQEQASVTLARRRSQQRTLQVPFACGSVEGRENSDRRTELWQWFNCAGRIGTEQLAAEMGEQPED